MKKKLFVLFVTIITATCLMSFFSQGEEENSFSFTVEELIEANKIEAIHDSGYDQNQWTLLITDPEHDYGICLQLGFPDPLAHQDDRWEQEYAKILFDSPYNGFATFTLSLALPDLPLGGAGYMLNYMTNIHDIYEWEEADLFEVIGGDYNEIELESPLPVVEGENILYLSHFGTIWGWPMMINSISYTVSEDTSTPTPEKTIEPTQEAKTTASPTKSPDNAIKKEDKKDLAPLVIGISFAGLAIIIVVVVLIIKKKNK